MPEGRIQFAKSHNPDRVWQADQIVHPNAADALTDLLFCVADRREVSARFARYTNRAVHEGNDVSTVTLDRSRLLFAEPDGATSLLGAEPPSLPSIAGQALRSTNLATTRRVRGQRRDAELCGRRSPAGRTGARAGWLDALPRSSGQ